VVPRHCVHHTVELATMAVEDTHRGARFQTKHSREMRCLVRRQVDDLAGSFGSGRVESDGHDVE